MKTVEFLKVSKRFGRKPVLNDCSWSMESGGVTVLLGRNGVGKSTALRLLAGLLRPNSGEVRVFDHDVAKSLRAVQEMIAYVPDTPDVDEAATLGDLVAFVRPHYPHFDDGLVRSLVQEWEIPTRQKFRTLSRGQRMKVMLLLALAPHPRLVLLDEPFGGLDPIARTEILKRVISSVDGEERNFLVATHDLDIAVRLADRVARLRDGVIEDLGSLEAVLQNHPEASAVGALELVFATTEAGS